MKKVSEDTLSPFEIKNELIDIATSHADKMMLNAGRGNPNFLATHARHAFLCLGDFAMQEAERSYGFMSAGFAGIPEKENIVQRFDTYASVNSTNQSVSFIQSALSFAADHIGIPKEELLHELTLAFLGCNYPVPPRMLRYCEEIVKVYLSTELCATSTKSDEFDIFATEGGTAAMTYIFDSLHLNGILNHGDKIAMITPIFSPYLEIPKIPNYDLTIVDIKADEGHDWQILDSELEKLLDPEIKLLFMVNPSNPPSVKMNNHFLEKMQKLVADKRKDLMIVTDDVYATFSNNFRSLLAVCPYNTLCVYSFSKYFGCTGWRLGTILLHENNIFDELLKQLSEKEKQRLDTRYESLTKTPRELKFIDRLVADSRSVALNHTAGLSLPQQLQMTLFAFTSLLDATQEYKSEAKNLIRRRYEVLFNAIGINPIFNEEKVGYYSVIDLEILSEEIYGTEFSKWFMQRSNGYDFAKHLAEETSVVLLPGKGFDVDHPSVRVSLANLTEYDYRAIGLAVKKLLAEFFEQFKK